MADWSQEPAWLACRRASLLEFLSDVVTLGLPMSLLGRSLRLERAESGKQSVSIYMWLVFKAAGWGNAPTVRVIHWTSERQWTFVRIFHPSGASLVRESNQLGYGDRGWPVIGVIRSKPMPHTNCCAPSCPTALHLFGGWPRESTPNKEMWITGGAFQIVNWYVASQGQP